MNSIASTYPDFQTLSRGIKRLLMTSETEFFNEARPVSAKLVPVKSRPTLFPRSHSIVFDRERLKVVDFLSFQPT